MLAEAEAQSSVAMERKQKKRKQGQRAAKNKSKTHRGNLKPLKRSRFTTKSNFASTRARWSLCKISSLNLKRKNKCLINQRRWQIFSRCVLVRFIQTRTACCIRCLCTLGLEILQRQPVRSTNESNTQIWTNSSSEACPQPQKAPSSFVLRKQFRQPIIVIIIPLFCVVHSSSDQSQPANSTFSLVLFCFFYLFGF